MRRLATILAAATLSYAFRAVSAQSCTLKDVPTSVPAPVVAQGYAVRLVAGGIFNPRDMKFDSAGNLLVVEQARGVRILTLNDDGGTCVGVNSSAVLIDDRTLNHGIELSEGGDILYASSSDNVYSYPYDVATGKVTLKERKTVITNMTTTDHVTRTLLLSKKVPGTLVVNRGSTANIDPLASKLSSGHSQVRAFDLTTRKSTYDFVHDGKLLGWGLRNDVGVDEHPVTGGIYTVENSVDAMMRDGKDIHENNPGEELNFLGYLNGTSSKNQGQNFGYPQCFSAWDVAAIPNNKGITPGSQFAIGESTSAKDKACRQNRIAPRLVFKPHMAPLDIKFVSSGAKGWVTFHGSHDRNVPDGYKVSFVDFDAQTGDPVKPSTSRNACNDVVTNQNPLKCHPNTCFRPVGLAFDKKGRLFFSSDYTGEIYVITLADGSGVE